MQKLLNAKGPRRPVRLIFLMAGFLFLHACQAGPDMVSTPIGGYNHTSAAINKFSVNGAGGPNIGPFQGGGSQVCCGTIPRVWKPGLKATVEWEVDPEPGAYNDWPEKTFSDGWRKRMREHRLLYVRHKETVDIPPYDSKEICSLKVHFLPCDKIYISTTCYTPSHPDYPHKDFFQMKDSASCTGR
ncbi:DUF3304 domain-containing protein [Pseudomonas aeruginosa]|uniref:DUF3304 domain-containing protein n=1 Tax=Pseudomonas aeruginosa TaxID=287 RepID=UPI0009F839F0|nr:DUF3304 domain-containing protein [Pseudomonas aeruginosa]EJB8384133.1 DUF3304 domain-containing protein [Pseudomonas aeruginosa]ORE46346.1 hypothetical protein B1H15_16835 [Pseudomonas aeruginosa]HBN9877070.1 DUF3304 domain-containing protein [Pseudomonas aeruginosa]HBO3774425.1 DUF3304 domain-containing protein [Pseudomonas aeruginosa]